MSFVMVLRETPRGKCSSSPFWGGVLPDQFGQQRFSVGENRCEDFVARLRDEYERAYYAGVVCERRAKAAFGRHMGAAVAYEWFQEAMQWYEKAETMRNPRAWSPTVLPRFL